MTDTRNAEERISLWLEEDAMRHFPDRLLKATYEQTRKSKQQVGWRGALAGLNVPRFATAIASAAVVVAGAALAFALFTSGPRVGPATSPTPSPLPTPTPTPDPWAAFIGTWISTNDSDGGLQTLTVERAGEGSVDVVVTDAIASVCEETPSTMVGTGHVEELARLVIPTPDYTCDDGSEPRLANGDPTPLNEFLRNLTYTLDPATGNLVIGETEVWVRQQDATPSQSPQPSDAPPSANASAEPAISGSWWPQSTLEEVRTAQDLADAGDPDYSWQVDPALVGGAEPWGSAVLDRFVRDGLGWEEYQTGNGYASDQGSLYTELVFLRCAPGETNPLYPDDPDAGACAPTIDDFRYETVMLTLEQPATRGTSGIWVVTEWQMLQPREPSSLFEHLYPDFTGGQYEQVAPPTDVEATALVEAFLDARVAGAGAGQYVHRHPGEDPISNSELVPMLLYGTTQSVPYDRYEIDRLSGPEWPTGWIEFRTRLFAQDGTEVEQTFAVVRTEDGDLGLVYGYPQTDQFPTFENGQPVPIAYRFLGGEVTFAAIPSWDGNPTMDATSTSKTLHWRNGERFVMVADPLPLEGCDSGPEPADAEALAQSIQSDANLDATAPVAVTVIGIDALQMDIVAAPGASLCGQFFQGPFVLANGASDRLELGEGNRMRLYLLDAPEGSSLGILAIAIAAPESEFERVVEEAAPIVDSIEFNAP